jgi:hypothetical protein
MVPTKSIINKKPVEQTKLILQHHGGSTHYSIGTGVFFKKKLNDIHL